MKARIFGLVVLVAVVSSLATMVAYDRMTDQKGDGALLSSPYQFTTANFPVAPSGMAPVDFTYAAALTTPTVVHVKTRYKQTAYYSAQSDIFRQFFGDDFTWESPEAQASGSGVIVDADGYIVTNYHFIKNAENIEVVFFDKQTATAELSGRGSFYGYSGIKSGHEKPSGDQIRKLRFCSRGRLGNGRG